MRWGEHPEHLPSEGESHRFWHYYNYVHAMRSDFENERMRELSEERGAGSGGSKPARPADDERMPDVRPGRSFPGLKTPLGGRTG